MPACCSPQEPDRRHGPGAQLQEGPPEQGTIHRATVRNVRPFGVFVEMEGYRRHGLVHNSQVSEDIAFSREDEDEAKVKAMEFFAPVGSQVSPLLCLHAAVTVHACCTQAMH